MRSLIISCEHASNTIPKAYRALFKNADCILNSHRGIDFGAFDLASVFEKTCDAPFFYATESRLLVDLNRSQGHPHLFSEYTRDLAKKDKQILLEQYYLPYRHAVYSCISELIQSGHPVLHLSVHSFTDWFDAEERCAEIGLLYDPRAPEERLFARSWRRQILARNRAYRVRMNYPYLGVSDGFVSHLRTCFKEEHYIGFELEVNQALSRRADALARLAEVLSQSFQVVWHSWQMP